MSFPVGVAVGALALFLLNPRQAQAAEAQGGVRIDPGTLGGGPTPSPLVAAELDVEKLTQAIQAAKTLDFREFLILGAIRMQGTTTVTFGERMADTRHARNLVFIVRNSQNQAITVQVVGDSANSPRNPAVNVGSSQSVAANTTISIIPQIEWWWHPWMGIKLTTGSTAPTTGQIQVDAFVQE